MQINDLRKPQSNKVPFKSLKIGQAYENNSKDICIKTSFSFPNHENYIYFSARTKKWEVGYALDDEMVIPLNIEINVLP